MINFLKKKDRSENQLKENHTVFCSEKSSLWKRIWGIAKETAEYTIKVLQSHWKNGIAWMADLSKIRMNQVQGIDGKWGTINIDWFEYSIVDPEDKKDLQDGNYYDLWKKRFTVVYNKWDNLLEYSPYRKSEKMIEKKTWKIFWKDDLIIRWFVWKIWEVLSDKVDKDPETGIIKESSSEYKDMIWRYDIGIWYFEWEVKNKYGFETHVWFEWNWVFRLDNWVVLIWDFTVEHYLDTRKIYWTWKIEYPNKKEEIWYRGWESGLYEKIYKEGK